MKESQANTNAFSHWRVWKVADILESHGLSTSDREGSSRYHSVTKETIHILRQWAAMATEDLKSLLNKRTLLHEIEESIVTCTFLIENLSREGDEEAKPVLVVDACCGKGICSLLLSYLAVTPLCSSLSISEIILFDRETDIDWTHIRRSNETAQVEDRPRLELWQGTDMHQTDLLLDRLLPYTEKFSLALLGIHLCRGLSPSFISLIHCLHNSCIFACLAPCCLPRFAHAMEIRQYEPHRNWYCTQCQRPRRRRNGCKCCLFCWRCGDTNHVVMSCTAISNKLNQPPTKPLSIDKVKQAQRGEQFGVYAQLLAEAIPLENVELVNTHLQPRLDKGNETNWNRHRKSLYIVATMQKIKEED